MFVPQIRVCATATSKTNGDENFKDDVNDNDDDNNRRIDTSNPGY